MARAHRATETLGVGAVACLGAALGAGVWRAVGWSDLPAVLAAVLAALVAADALSGLVHWWADRMASEDTPWLGPNFVRAFREHHEDPQGITRHDFVETNGNTCIAIALPLAAVWVWAPPATSGAAPLALQVFSVSLAFWIALTNQIHKWAHSRRPGRRVAWAQRHHLILGPGHHGAHHVAPYDRRYCITTGWLNPLLDACRVFPGLEHAFGSSRRGRRREAA